MTAVKTFGILDITPVFYQHYNNLGFRISSALVTWRLFHKPQNFGGLKNYG